MSTVSPVYNSFSRSYGNGVTLDPKVVFRLDRRQNDRVDPEAARDFDFLCQPAQDLDYPLTSSPLVSRKFFVTFSCSLSCL